MTAGLTLKGSGRTRVIGHLAALLLVPVVGYALLRYAPALDTDFADRVFWVFAILPGLTAVLNFLLSVDPHYELSRRAVEPYLQVRRRQIRLHGAEHQGWERAVTDMRPSLASVVIGAGALTVVFALPAALSSPRRPSSLGLERSGAPTEPSRTPTTTPTAQLLHSLAGGSPPQSPTGPPAGPVVSRTVTPQTTSAPDVRTGHAPTTSGPILQSTAAAPTLVASPLDDSRPLSDGVIGLVFAGYGAYVYTFLLVIGRLNSSALTGKFLLTSSIRSGISLLLGYVVGVFGLFSAITTPKASLFLYFALGLFPSWALGALRNKAKEVFQPAETGCEVLPLCLVDGVEDGVIDRLAEIGITDVEHLATAEPVEFALRTLYPFNRVLDWVDQAILINYVKHAIADFRRQGIRSSIELATLYGDATLRMGTSTGVKPYPATTAGPSATSETSSSNTEGQRPPSENNTQVIDLEDSVARQTRAKAIITSLSQKTTFSEQSLYAIGRSLFEDYLVNRIWAYWQHVAEETRSAGGERQPDGQAASRPVVAADTQQVQPDVKPQL